MTASETLRADGERIYLFVQHLHRRLRLIDASEGISASRFSALASLVFHGAKNIGDLAAGEGVAPPSMTRLIRDMERDGLVRRQPDPDDGRGVMIVVTLQGRATLSRVRKRKIALVSDYLATQPARVRDAAALAFAALEDLAEPPEERLEP